MAARGPLALTMTTAQLKDKIERTLRLGMSDGVFLAIEYVHGFERFNTRAYHCYETWCGGWRVTDPRTKKSYERENLDDAIEAWAKGVEEARNATN